MPAPSPCRRACSSERTVSSPSSHRNLAFVPSSSAAAPYPPTHPTQRRQYQASVLTRLADPNWASINRLLKNSDA